MVRHSQRDPKYASLGLHALLDRVNGCDAALTIDSTQSCEPGSTSTVVTRVDYASTSRLRPHKFRTLTTLCARALDATRIAYRLKQLLVHLEQVDALGLVVTRALTGT